MKPDELQQMVTDGLASLAKVRATGPVTLEALSLLCHRVWSVARDPGKTSPPHTWCSLTVADGERFQLLEYCWSPADFRMVFGHPNNPVMRVVAAMGTATCEQVEPGVLKLSQVRISSTDRPEGHHFFHSNLVLHAVEHRPVDLLAG